MDQQIMIRPLGERDYEPLAQLYEYYTRNTVYTYYTGEVDATYMKRLFDGRGHACSVAVDGNRTVGYVHISPAFGLKHPCSMAVYLDPQHVGQRIGPKLVREGERLGRALGYKTMKVTVCTENDRSLRMFDAMGYRHTGMRTADAYKFGRFLDTALFARSLEDDEST